MHAFGAQLSSKVVVDYVKVLSLPAECICYFSGPKILKDPDFFSIEMCTYCNRRSPTILKYNESSVPQTLPKGLYVS